MNTTLKFRLRNETKGAVRYEELDASGAPVEQLDSVIGTLYIRKSALNGTTPATLTITVQS